MVNQNTNLQNEKELSQLFAKARVTDHDLEESNFKEELRYEVLKHYINYDNAEEMSEKKTFWRRKPLFLMGGAFTFILLVGAIVLFSNLQVSPTPKEVDTRLRAAVAYEDGDLEILNIDDEWIDIDERAILEEGKSIRVNGEGRAIINLDDGSSIRLRSNSAVTFESMDPNHIVLANDAGYIYSRVMEMERTFDVKVGDATFTSLGTAYMTVNEIDKKGVEVFQSKVEVNYEKKVIVDEGQKYYYEYKQTPENEKTIKDISLEDIKNNEFILWNKEQDEKSNEYKENLGVLKDLEAPALTISSPQNNQITKEDSILVEGVVEPGATIKVNDQKITNNDGVISHKHNLSMGDNKIVIEAIDTAGNKTSKSITVKREVKNDSGDPKPQPSLSLSGKAVSNGIQLTWSVKDLDVSYGFKILKSTSPNPVLEGNEYKYIGDPFKRDYVLNIQNGETYNFRICQYLANGKCGVYSNNIAVTAPNNQSQGDKVNSISLSFVANNKVTWSVDGYSTKGFKLVWSLSPNPVYPGNDHNYYSDPNANYGFVDGESGKTYYVRVCEYLGGSCGKYSNEITVTL